MSHREVESQPSTQLTSKKTNESQRSTAEESYVEHHFTDYPEDQGQEYLNIAKRMAKEILKNIITPINDAASQQSALLVTILQEQQSITANINLSHLTHKLDVMTGKYHGTAQFSLSINADIKKELINVNQNINRQLDYLIKLNQNIKDTNS